LRLGLKVVPRAEREIRRASAWWRTNRPASPELLYQELRRVFELITTQPAVGLRVEDTKLPNVRRVQLLRVRYDLYYRVRGETVSVLAFWQANRGASPRL